MDFNIFAQSKIKSLNDLFYGARIYHEKQFIVSTYTEDLIIKDPDMISMKKINKIRYYNHFFKDFLSSIYLECY